MWCSIFTCKYFMKKVSSLLVKLFMVDTGDHLSRLLFNRGMKE